MNHGDGTLLLVGLVGGVASGKSLVADQLKSLGAEVLDGDRAGHEVLKQEAVKNEIRRRWGDYVFLADGNVNRAALARIVFAPDSTGRAELEQLEQLTHPAIKILLERQLAEMRARGVPVCVLDAPVMIKAGWHKLCNTILFVDAPEAQRSARAKTRGWEAAEFTRREAAQEPLELKRSLADVVIDNSGTAAATRQQVQAWWNAAVKPPN